MNKSMDLQTARDALPHLYRIDEPSALAPLARSASSRTFGTHLTGEAWEPVAQTDDSREFALRVRWQELDAPDEQHLPALAFLEDRLPHGGVVTVEEANMDTVDENPNGILIDVVCGFTEGDRCNGLFVRPALAR